MIFDCFPFFNELDLLEIRLHELNDMVDVFVLSEATLTFTGKPKPLYYNDNKHRYAKFADKIQHVVIDSYNGIDTSDSWSMDRGQKQVGVDSIQFSEGDVVILSDCDEIPRASSIKGVLKEDWDRMAIEMPIFYYYMNCMCTSKKWRFPQIIRPKKNIKLSRIRGRRSDKVVTDGGWHFGYLNSIKLKIQSWTHTEYNKPPYNTQGYINERREAGLDLFGRGKYRFEFLNDLSYLPKYVLSNMDRFGKYIKQ